MSAKPTAYSYLRFSTPEQAQGDSQRRQVKLAEDYARQHGLRLDTELTFEDLGVSAYRGRNVEDGALGGFREAIRAGLVAPGSYLLVESLDRISRQAARKALRVLEDIVDEGVTVVTLSDGRAYSSESLDRDYTSLLLSVLEFIRAHEESANKSRRLKAAWKQKRAEGREDPEGAVLTARVPGWLMKENGSIEVHEDRAKIVRRIFRDTLAGKGQHAITRELNGDGVPTFGRSDRWHRSYVHKILRNEAVVGTYTPHTTTYEGGKTVREPLEPIEGYYPAIVDEDTFDHVQAMFGGSDSTPARGALRNIWSGLLRCGRCGGTATRLNKGTSKSGNPWTYLVCTNAKAGNGCTYELLRYGDVEARFLEAAPEIIAEAPAGEDMDGEIEQARNNLAGLEDLISDALDVAMRVRSRAADERLEELEDARAEAERDLRGILARAETAQGRLVRYRLDQLAEALEAEPLDRPAVNAVLRQCFESVTLDYEAWDVVLHWRHGGVSRFWYQAGREFVDVGE